MPRAGQRVWQEEEIERTKWWERRWEGRKPLTRAAYVQGHEVASSPASSFDHHSHCSWPNFSSGCWCMGACALKVTRVGVVKTPAVPGGPLPVFHRGQQLLLPLACTESW